MKVKLLYIFVLILIASCDVTDPRDNVNIILNADIKEEVLEAKDVSIQGSKKQLLSNKIISVTNNAYSNNLEKKNASEYLMIPLGKISFSIGFLNFEGSIKNNSGQNVSLKFFLSKKSDLDVPNDGDLILSYILNGNETYNSFNLMEENIEDFLSGSSEKEVYLYIFLEANSSANIVIEHLSLILPPVVKITNIISPPEEDYNLNDIFSTKLSGTIMNTDNNTAFINVFLSDSLSFGEVLKDEDLILSTRIEGNSQLNLSNLTLSQNVKSKLTSLIDRKADLESNVVFTSNGNSLSLKISQITLDAELKVSLDINK